MSCLTSLFGVQEFKIYDDYLQISELVVIKEFFKNRSITSNESIIMNEETNEYVNEYGVEYFDRPAILREKVHAKNEKFKFVLEQYKYLYTDFWILGDNYNETLEIISKKDMRCSGESCYDKSLQKGEICQPGTFCQCF